MTGKLYIYAFHSDSGETRSSLSYVKGIIHNGSNELFDKIVAAYKVVLSHGRKLPVAILLSSSYPLPLRFW